MTFLAKHRRFLAATVASYLCWTCSAFSQSRTPLLPSGFATEKDVQFFFTAPVGWRLRKYAKYSYMLEPASGGAPACSFTLFAENSATLIDAENSRLAKLRSVVVGPSEPVIHRIELRARNGIHIQKADARFDVFSQPRLKRGAVYPLRGIFYAFRPNRSSRIYGLESYPPVGESALLIKALDEVARSVSF